MTKEQLQDQVNDFFSRYPEAECVHEVSTQLFHANAEDAAKARAAHYGLTVQTFENPKAAKAKDAKAKAEAEAKAKTEAEAKAKAEGVKETNTTAPTVPVEETKKAKKAK